MIDTAPGKASVLAGRIASPIDEALIPPVVVRPAGSRALPMIDTAPGRASVLTGRIASHVDEALMPPVWYGPPGVGPYQQKRPRIAEPLT